MSSSLPYSTNDVHYDNAKFRHRSFFKVMTQIFHTSNIKRDCVTCSTGKFLVIIMTFGLAYLMLTHTSPVHSVTDGLANSFRTSREDNVTIYGGSKFGRFLRKPPQLPPRLSSDDKGGNDTNNTNLVWKSRQQKVKEAFTHAWSGYKRYAMGYDELMPVSQHGVDGLGGLGATIVDALDTAMIMGVEEVVTEAGTWIETQLPDRISKKGQVNLFETTIRVLGGLLSAYHLSGGNSGNSIHKGPKPIIYLETARNLADRLLSAFTSSPTPIPFSDVILRDSSGHAAPGGLSSTSEVSTLQLEFNYLNFVSGDPKYSIEAMKVLEHMKTLPKVEGLVPIYISPNSGEFAGENIRLGSRGDSYYEYLIKVWLQQRAGQDSNLTYLHDMYTEAMKGVRKLLVQKSMPSGLVFVGELPYGAKGSFSPKMDHLVRTSQCKTAAFRPCLILMVPLVGETLCVSLALGATKGITKEKAKKDNLLTFEDLENLQLAEDLAKTCFEMYAVTSTGLAPEIAYFHTKHEFSEGPGGGNKSSKYVNDIIIKPADRHNLLRPETVESLFILYRITEDTKYREWGWQIFEAFEKHTKVTSGGYSSLYDVTILPPQRRDKMETFFLGETLKYLYLLFADSSTIPLDMYVFNTEAHPFPIQDIIKAK